MKTLRKGLAEIGFKPQHITKIIEAVSFIRWIKPSDTFEPCDFGGSIEEYEQDKEFYKWSKSLSISAQYELSNMERPNHSESIYRQEELLSRTQRTIKQLH